MSDPTDDSTPDDDPPSNDATTPTDTTKSTDTATTDVVSGSMHAAPSNTASRPTDAATSADGLRYRQLIDEHYAVILAVLLVVGSVGLWMGYTAFLAPSTVSEEQTMSSWSKTSDFTHGAKVTKQNPVYDVGTRLRDRQAYFPLIAPFLSGEHEFGYAASENASMDAETTLQLRIRSTDGENTYWESTQRLGANNASDLRAGETLRTSYRFNMNRSRATIERIDDTFGETIGDPEVVVQATTRVTGEVNGRTVDRSFTSSVVLKPEGDAFVVDDPGRVRDSFSQTQTVQSDREYSLLWKVSVPVLLVVGFGGAGAFAWLRRLEWFSLDWSERNRLTRGRYEEWISHADLPEQLEYPASKTVAVRSLMDLVDVAADSNNRVLYDPSQDRYVVLDDEQCYVFTEEQT